MNQPVSARSRSLVALGGSIAVVAEVAAVVVGRASSVAPDVRPVLECVEVPATPGGPYHAHFGNLSEYATTRTIAAGPGNQLIPALAAQPELPTVCSPGRQCGVFSVESDGAPILWRLTDLDGSRRTLTASSGSAYVFARMGGTWSEQAKLLDPGGAAFDAFGWSVSLDGESAVIGAYGDDDVTTDQGAAHVFARTGATWTHEALGAAPDAGAGDTFGWSVSISGDTLVVGAHLDDETSGADQGSAYVLVRTGGVWAVQSKLIAADGTDVSYFGRAVSVDGDRIVAGAHLDDVTGSDSGAAFLFTRAGATWAQRSRFTAADTAPGDWFGYSVAAHGSTAVLGAMLDDDRGPDSGSISTFLLPPP
jgi:FG-GAP repeat